MIQFNLLPDIKLQYIKAAKTKRLVITSSILVSAVVLILVGFLSVGVLILQKKHLANLSRDVTALSNELTSTKDIDKILTVQNQLNSLPGVHEQKPAASRMFEYLSQVTPADVSITNLQIKFTESSMIIEGGAKSIATVNQFVDTLKFTNYREDIPGGGPADQLPAFKEVVLDSFSVEIDTIEFSIDFKYDPEIFNGTKIIKLIVPNITTTRSEVEKPNIFQDSSGGQ